MRKSRFEHTIRSMTFLYFTCHSEKNHSDLIIDRRSNEIRYLIKIKMENFDYYSVINFGIDTCIYFI